MLIVYITVKLLTVRSKGCVIYIHHKAMEQSGQIKTEIGYAKS